MVALVTGHHGFLGSRVVTQLEAAGLVVAGAGRPEVEIPSETFDRILGETHPN
ncbi:MAG: NAD-dependent epimerase/dehydratase family protein, partial [Gaiellaceae bacterium]